jgi:hypothetical protein
LVTDLLVADLVAGAFAAVFFAAGAVRADLLVTFAEAVEVFEAVLLTTAFLRVMTFDEVAQAGLAAGLVGELVRRVPVAAGLLDREAAAGRLAVRAAAAEALPVPATRARVVVLGLSVARVPLDDERPVVALLVLLALAAFLGAARLAVARPEAAALRRRSPVVPAAMIDYLTPRVITNTGGGRWIGPPRVPSTRRAARLCPEEYPPRCRAETRRPGQSAAVSGDCVVTRSDAINHPEVQFLPDPILRWAARRSIGRNLKIEYSLSARQCFRAACLCRPLRSASERRTPTFASGGSAQRHRLIVTAWHRWGRVGTYAAVSDPGTV